MVKDRELLPSLRVIQVWLSTKFLVPHFLDNETMPRNLKSTPIYAYSNTVFT